jgi:hypothetical protein
VVEVVVVQEVIMEMVVEVVVEVREVALVALVEVLILMV